MKKLIYILFCSCALLACKADNFEENPSIKFNFGVEGTTRALDSSFELTDAVGVYNFNDTGVLYSNVLFANTASGFKSFEQMYYPSSNSVDFMAYYPYSETSEWTPSSVIPWQVFEAQWESLNYTNSDFMVANAENVANGTKSVALQFKHVMSKIEINFVPGLGYTAETLLAEEINVKIKNSNLTCNIDPTTSAITALSNVMDIEPTDHLKIVNGKVVGANAIVVPQTIPENTLFIEVEKSGIIYTYTTDKALECPQGKKLRFNLTITDMSIEFSSEIVDWAQGDPITGDGELEAETAVDYDKNVYDVVTIGAQKWLSKNLETMHFNDGTPIVLADMMEFMGHGAKEFHAVSTIGENTHILYNYKASISGKLCPYGWRLPSDADFKILIKHLTATNAGQKTKATTGWSDGASENPEYQGDGTTKFNAIPTGVANADAYGRLDFQNAKAGLWIEGIQGIKVYSYAWTYDSKTIKQEYGNPNSCLGVRCIKD